MLILNSILKSKAASFKTNSLGIIFFLFLNLQSDSQSIPADTSIRGVLVSFRYSVSIFPDSWQVAPINAQGEQLNSSEAGRCKSAIINALKKYPIAALKKNLRAVYFLKDMKFYDVGYGGTNSNDALYLTNDGEDMGYTDLYLEQTFHHEFSSILYRNNPLLFDDAAWIKVNMPGFDYNDPENGVGAIRNNQSSQELDSVLCKKGFLTQYALSSLENDINTLAQNIFSPGEGFWNLVDGYPRISQKVKLMISFYHKIDPAFTETYFRNLNL